jgi:hypothetical protein
MYAPPWFVDRINELQQGGYPYSPFGLNHELEYSKL